MRNFKYIFLTISIFCLPIAGQSQQSLVQNLVQEAYKEAAEEEATAGRILARWLRVYDAIDDGGQVYLLETCNSIAQIYVDEQLYEQALPYYLKAVSALKNKDNVEKQSEDLYKKLGQTYANLANPDSAIYFYNKILAKQTRMGNTLEQVKVLQEMVEVFSINGNYEKALDLNLKVKKLLEEHNSSNKVLMQIYNNLGYNYNQLEKYAEAIIYFEKALTLLDQDDYPPKAILETNIGIAYYNLDDFNKSIDFLNAAKKTKNRFAPDGRDEIDHLIATVYLRKKDLYNALNYSEKSVKKAKKTNNALLLSDIYYTSALIHSELYEYDVALDFFQKHLQLRDSFALEEKLRQQKLLQNQIDLERTEKQIKLFMINQDVQELAIAQLKVETENQELALKNKEAELVAGQKEKELLQKDNVIKASRIQTQELETQGAKQELELARQRLLAAKQELEVDRLQQVEAMTQLELKSTEAQLNAEQKEKDLLKRDKEIGDLKLEKQSERLQSLYGLGGLLTVIMLLIGAAWAYSRKLNQELNKKNHAIEQQKEEITTERNKSDQLLLNILPEETAEELKENGFALPKSYDKATVMFTDFSGFTRVAATMTPEQLIEELNYCFQAFDTIIDKHGLEKIKTIGDAYMCVAGIPVPDESHSLRAIKAGKEIVAFMENRIAGKKAANQLYWQMRMGIHSGPVIAGVVGKKKFAYDIWGDTVNTASRMESNGEVGKINISEATYQLIKKEYNCTSRGKITAKNLGEVNMYFVI